MLIWTSISSAASTARRLLGEVLEILAGLEPDGPSWWNPDLPAGAGVSADALLPGLDLKDAKASQLDALSAAHRLLHGIQDGLHGDYGLHARDIGRPGDLVDDVGLDHPAPPSGPL